MSMRNIPGWSRRISQERIRRNWRQQDLAEQLGTTRLTIHRWENGSQQPSAYYRLKLCALFGKSAEELGLVGVESTPLIAPEYGPSSIMPTSVSPPTGGGLWIVPYPRNPFFTGREEFLSHIHEQLHRECRLALSQSWAISGLGGIGKTQIALEYAYRYRQDYHAIFWISAASRETLLTGLVSIADLLQLPEKNEQDHNKVLSAVKHWLATHQHWLLVLDNADDITVVRDMASPECSGHLLLTTRAQALGSLAQRLDIEIMGVAEGTLFLLRRSKLLAPDASFDDIPQKYLASAEAILIDMDFLPLALDQAGAYIEEVGCSLTAYLDLYRTHRAELLRRRGQIPTNHPESVTTTWSLSFQKIEQANPAAADLLRLCSFLDPDTIPEESFSEGSAVLGQALQDVTTDAFLLNEAIEELRKFSLVQRDPEAKLLHVHRLVQAVLRDAMEEEKRCQWAERAVRVIDAAFPQAVETVTWPHCRRMLSQAQAGTALIQIYAFAFSEAASLLYRTACYLDDFALYEQAEPLLLQARFIWEQVLGPEHPRVAHVLTRLAPLSFEQNKHEQAEHLYQQALRIQQQAFGPEHPEVASSLRGLANVSLQRGKYKQAEHLYQQVLRIQQQAFGPEHPDVASSLEKLATLYRLQGQYEQAESLFQQALDLQEKIFVFDHENAHEL